MRALRTIAQLFVMLVVSSGSTAFGADHPTGPTSAFVRFNLVGYVPSESKRAVLMASESEAGASFEIVAESGTAVYQAPIGTALGNWSSSYPNTYLLDFSQVTQVGTYTIRVTGS